MKRVPVKPRENWPDLLDALDFDGWRRPDGSSWWVEDACFEFSEAEIEELHLAALECEVLVRDALKEVIEDEALLREMGLGPRLAATARESWRRLDPSLYGRFDFAWDGVSPPKLLEYNADTPTSLYEAAVVQWRWLVDRDPDADQYNAIHEHLIAAWTDLAQSVPAGGRAHFSSLLEDPDDAMTSAYMKDCAMQAGIATETIDISDIGLRGGRLVDLADREITHLFKLYPWEWLAEEDLDFFMAIRDGSVAVVEPAWRVAASSKGLLPELWRRSPGHPNLLAASWSPDGLGEAYVSKAVLGREGANIQIHGRGGLEATGGRFGAQPVVHQSYAEMGSHDGRIPVFGVWVVGGKPCGLGVREDVSPITGPRAWFIPHRIAS